MNDSRLSKKQAAEYLGISVRQMQRLMTAKRIDYSVAQTPAGAMAFFDRAELERVKDERARGVSRPSVISETSEGVSDVRGGALARIDAAAAPALERLAELLDARSRDVAPLSDLAHKHWLTRREAIALSGLPVAVIDDALKSRKLGAKSGGRWLVKRTDMERFAAMWKPR